MSYNKMIRYLFVRERIETLTVSPMIVLFHCLEEMIRFWLPKRINLGMMFILISIHEHEVSDSPPVEDSTHLRDRRRNTSVGQTSTSPILRRSGYGRIPR